MGTRKHDFEVRRANVVIPILSLAFIKLTSCTSPTPTATAKLTPHDSAYTAALSCPITTGDTLFMDFCIGDSRAVIGAKCIAHISDHSLAITGKMKYRRISGNQIIPITIDEELQGPPCPEHECSYTFDRVEFILASGTIQPIEIPFTLSFYSIHDSLVSMTLSSNTYSLISQWTNESLLHEIVNILQIKYGHPYAIGSKNGNPGSNECGFFNACKYVVAKTSSQEGEAWIDISYPAQTRARKFSLYNEYKSDSARRMEQQLQHL